MPLRSTSPASSSRVPASSSASGSSRRFSIAALLLFSTVCSTPLLAELVIPVDGPPPAGGKPNTIAVPDAKGSPAGEPAAAPKAGADAETPDLLFFINGDKIRGKLLQADAGNSTMKWKTSQAQQDILFNLPGLKEVLMGDRPGQPAPVFAEGSFAVTLKNGDELPGTIVTMDDKELVLDTPYAGKLTIDRKALAGMVPMRGASNVLFDGPKDMEGWETQQGQRNTWRYKDGSLISMRNGFTGKDFKLPDMCTIEFDLSWSGNFSLGVSFYTDELKGYGGNSYMMQISNSYLYLSRMSRNGGQNQLGQVQVDSMQRKNSTRIRISVNKEQKTIALFVDDALVKTFKDTGNFAGGGTGISFYNQGQGLVRIRRLRISKWDGRIAEESTLKAGTLPDDTILLANQDKVTGKITSIKNGAATLESPYATLSVPLARVDVVTFATPAAPADEKKGDPDKDKDKDKDKDLKEMLEKEKKKIAAEAANADMPVAQGDNPNAPKPVVVEAPKRVPGEVGVHLVGRGRITIKLEKWEGDKLVGTSASMGKLTILPQSVRVLRFGQEPAPNLGAAIPSSGEESGEGDGSSDDEEIEQLLKEDVADGGQQIPQPIFNRRIIRR